MHFEVHISGHFLFIRSGKEDDDKKYKDIRLVHLIFFWDLYTYFFWSLKTALFIGLWSMTLIPVFLSTAVAVMKNPSLEGMFY